MVSDALVAAYRATDYIVYHSSGTLVLKLGVHLAAMDRLFAQTGTDKAAFITAENPRSQRLSMAENAQRQGALYAELAAQNGLEIVPASGVAEGRTAEDWPAEASFLVLGIGADRAMELANRYEQNAFLWVEHGGAARLVFPASEIGS